jgi:hypothetical protein
MFEFLRFQPRLPGLKYFPMESYSTNLVLEGLVVGVDNIRFDVRLSPDFCNKTAKLASLLIEQETGIWTENEKEQLADLSRRQESYCQGYDEIMSDAIDKARAAKEIRVDYLAQIAILSMVHEEIRKQYDNLIRYCKSAIRRLGLDSQENHKNSLRLKENLAHVLRVVKECKNVSASPFADTSGKFEKPKSGKCARRYSAKTFSFSFRSAENPIIHMDNPFNDHFMIEEYDICLGRREEDPDRYERMHQPDAKHLQFFGHGGHRQYPLDT